MFKFDFSQANKSYMQTYQITESEVKTVFTNKFSKPYNSDDLKYLFIIGYSVRRKMLTVIFDYKSSSAEIRILNVRISNEKEIRKNYCS